MLSALLLGDQTEVGIIRISQKSGELSCPTDTSRKSKDPQNISDPDCQYLNVQHRYRKSARTSLCLSEPIRMIYVSLGLDENWVSYRVPQPRIEVVGRGRGRGRGTRPVFEPRNS